MSFLRVKDLTIEDFTDLIHKYHTNAKESFDTIPLLVAFSPAKAVFKQLELDEPFFEATEQGRIFSPEGELKWRHVNNQMRVVFLGAIAPPEGLIDRSNELEKLVKDSAELILWGEWRDSTRAWIEQQVPHRFQYPILSRQFSRGRAVIVIESWNDAFGFPQFSRYYCLKEISGENHAKG